MFKLTIFLVFLVLAGIYALESTNDTIEDNEIRSVKLPPIFQLPVYRKILARRNIVPEIREKDAQTDKLVPKSILDPFSSSPSGTAFDPSKVQLNSGLANITNALIKPSLPPKGALIGTALATPIRMYTHFINQLARSINPQIVPATRQTSLFDLPIDPRVSHVDPDHSAVLLAIRNNAELIGKQMAQMGHEIKRTGKNISSVGINLLEFQQKGD
ncbi:hypothetical protein TYRP_000680 [Tyrophagus putrescentiae]|nr:hypothetical protein TYRP_000680 [Tyrophagus putrescentiae]